MALVLMLATLSLLPQNPFDDLGKIDVLKDFTESRDLRGYYRPRAELIAPYVYSKSGVKVQVTAYRFEKQQEVEPAIRQSFVRSGVEIKLPVPELEKLGFKVSAVGNGTYIESDIVEGKVWARVVITRRNLPAVTVTSRTGWSDPIAKQLRKDKPTMDLLTSLLPEVRKRVKKANASPD